MWIVNGYDEGRQRDTEYLFDDPQAIVAFVTRGGADNGRRRRNQYTIRPIDVFNPATVDAEEVD